MFKKILQYLRPKSLLQSIALIYIIINGIIILSALIWSTVDKGIEPIGNLGALIMIVVGQGLISSICLIALLIRTLYNFFHKQSFLHELLAFLTLTITLIAIISFFNFRYTYFISSLALSILYNQNRIKTDEEQKYDRNY